MQVRAGRTAGRADVGDHLALVHPLALAHCPAREVAVAGRPLAVVLDLEPAAVAAGPAGLLDHSVAGGEHRGAARGAEIDAGVHFGEAQDRVQPEAEAGCDVGAVERGAQQETADVLAVAVEVLRLRRPGGFEAIEAGGLTLGPDLGIEQVAAFHGAAGLAHLAVEHQAELVVGVDVAAEVQLVREQLDHLGGQLGGGPGGDGRRIERIGHPPLGDGGLVLDLLLGLMDPQGAVEGARERDGGGRAGAHGKPDQPHRAAVVERPGDGRLEGQARLDVHRVEGLAHHPHGLLGLDRRQAQAQQRLLQRLARQHLHGHLLEALDPGLGLGAGGRRRGGGDVRGRRLARRDRLLHGQPPAHRQGGEARDADQKPRRVPDRWMSRIELLHRSPELRWVPNRGGRSALSQLRPSMIPLSQIRAYRRSSTASAGRHSLAPLGLSTIGRSTRIGWATMASMISSSETPARVSPSSSAGVPRTRRMSRGATPMRATRAWSCGRDQPAFT